MFPSSKVIMLTAASASLALAGAGAASAQTASTNPYVAGDMHNHNTCTDGTVSAGYAIDRSVASGVAAGGGKNFNLDWFTLGNHGGAGKLDCRFANSVAKLPGETDTTWSQTLGQTINGITITSLKGTPNGTGTNAQMWRWQSIEEIEYPIIVNRTQMYNKVLVEGLEWVVPGHEHTDVAVLTGQNPMGSGNASNVAQFEFLFDRQDNDAIGPVDANNNPIWTGKSFSNDGTAGHAKAVTGIKWLQARYPLASYAIPTHSERAGAFSTTTSAGYNIEHFRDFNNAGPTVAFGIESPGHMAQGTTSGGSGSYTTSAVGGGTYGFGGVYTAKVGGLWDGLLGEGRNSFIYVSSDWHTRGTFGARDAATNSDFIPGEYTKLYVPNVQGFNAQAIVNGMRSGNSYSVNADIIGPDMVFRAHGNDGIWKTMGETLVVTPGETITLEMQMTVPPSNNSPYSFNNPLLAPIGINQPLNKPMVDHVDLITGQITGVIAPTDPNYSLPKNVGGVAGAALVYNPTTVIAQQVQASAMTSTPQPDGSTRLQFTRTFTAGNTPMYIRSRGTNIPNATPNVSDAAGNPLIDVTNTNVVCSDPACPSHLTVVNGAYRVTADVQAYSNVWFYANPIFIRPAGTPLLLVETNAALAKGLAVRSAGR